MSSTPSFDPDGLAQWHHDHDSSDYRQGQRATGQVVPLDTDTLAYRWYDLVRERERMATGDEIPTSLYTYFRDFVRHHPTVHQDIEAEMHRLNDEIFRMRNDA